MNRYEVQLSNELWIEIETSYNYKYPTIVNELSKGTWFLNKGNGAYINPAHIMQVRELKNA